MGNKSVNWNATFNAAPQGSEDINQADDRIVETRAGVQERLNEEHVMEFDALQGDQGIHKPGSARLLVQATAPTRRLDGTTYFTTARDKGLQWVDSTTGIMYVLLSANGSGTDVWGKVTPDSSTGNFTVGGDLLVSTDGVITRDLRVGRNLDVDASVNVDGNFVLDGTFTRASIPLNYGFSDRYSAGGLTFSEAAFFAYFEALGLAGVGSFLPVIGSFVYSSPGDMGVISSIQRYDATRMIMILTPVTGARTSILFTEGSPSNPLIAGSIDLFFNQALLIST